MHNLDSPGEPWTKEDCQNHYNQMDPKDAEYYQRGNALRSLSRAISTLEKEIEELTAVNNQGQQRDDTVHSLSGAISNNHHRKPPQQRHMRLWGSFFCLLICFYFSDILRKLEYG